MSGAEEQKRRVAIVTSTRAEYGLLRELIRHFHESTIFELQLLVTGTHLDRDSGFTVEEIEKDAFPISRRVSILDESDGAVGMARGAARAALEFTEVFHDLTPDLVLVLGDRFEILGVVQAAFLLGLPVAHIHGGEVTVHAVDDSIRHAITKLSFFHFVSAAEYGHRVVQLGEAPERVFNVGAPGLDNIRKLTLLSRETLRTEIGFEVDENTLLVTYHPETLGGESIVEIEHLFRALDAMPEFKILMTAPNVDAGGRELLKKYEDYCLVRPTKAKLVRSLGILRYLSAMKLAGAVVGNSSSGIIEAPFMRTPTVNIGGRQDGRIRAASVFDVPMEMKAIEFAVRAAVSSKARGEFEKALSPFGDGHASERIFETLARAEWPKMKPKKFYDVGFSL